MRKVEYPWQTQCADQYSQSGECMHLGVFKRGNTLYNTKEAEVVRKRCLGIEKEV